MTVRFKVAIQIRLRQLPGTGCNGAVLLRGCLKSPARSRLTVCGPGFAPAVWKLEWGTIVCEIWQNRDFSNTLLLRQVRQQLLYPLNKRRELIWILLRKRFINLHGLFKCPPRLRWSVPGAIQNTHVVERRGDVRQISLRLFLCQLTVDLQRLLGFLPSLAPPIPCIIKKPHIVKRHRYGW